MLRINVNQLNNSTAKWTRIDSLNSDVEALSDIKSFTTGYHPASSAPFSIKLHRKCLLT